MQPYHRYSIFALLLLLPFGYLSEFITLFICILLNHDVNGIFKFKTERFISIINASFFFVLTEIIIISSLEYSIQKFFEQLLMISVFFLLYRSFARRNFVNPEQFCKIYLDFTLLLSLYSLVGYIIGVTYGGRAVGWAGEAGDLSLLVLPSICYYVHVNKYGFKFAIIALSFFFASSAASFGALLILLSLRFLIVKGQLLIRIISATTLAVVIILFASFLFNEQTRNSFEKLEKTIVLFSSKGDQIQNAEEANFSTYAFLTNLTVAQEAPYRICGTGLGTHRDSYGRVYPEYKSGMGSLYGLNRDDAYSFGIRVFSEFGWIGLIIVLFFYYKWFNINNVYNFMALGYLVNAFITGGHYTNRGLILFIFLYYFTRKKRISKTIISQRKVASSK